jgi:O-antigen ligase
MSRNWNQLTGDPNYYACYLIMVLSVTIGFAAIVTSVWKRVFFAVFALIQIIATILTISRSGYITLVIVAIIYGFYFYHQLDFKKILATFAVIIVSMTTIVLLTTNIATRFVNLFAVSERVEQVMTGEDKSVNQRANILVVASRIIADHPIIGIGYGNFQATFDKYRHGLLSTENHRVAHNTYATVFAESGIIGIFGAAVFIIALFSYLLRVYRSVQDRSQKTILFSLMTSIIAFLIMSVTLEQLNESHFWVFAGTAVAYAALIRIDHNTAHRN